MNATTELIKRETARLSAQAKEPVTVEQVSGALYVCGSELAVLRLFAHYNANGAVQSPSVRCGFSANLNTWFLSIERS